MKDSGERLFEAAEADIHAALKLTAYRRRLNPTEFEDLRSFVLLKLVEKDYARLRKHNGDGSMRAYLSVVVQRLYLDYKVWCFGKWHPSAEATRRGPIALELERLIYRDGFEPREAVAYASMRFEGDASEDELWRTAYALPVRQRAKFVSDENFGVASFAAVEDPVLARENAAARDRLHEALRRAFASLGDFDRGLLALRYRDQCTVPEIAARLGVEAKPLYARIRRLLVRVRNVLEAADLGAEEAIAAVLEPSASFDLDGVFSSAA